MPYTPFSRVTYTSNGSDSEFAIPFPYLYEATLQVTRGGFRQYFPTDFTINRDTRRIVFENPLPAGMTLTIKRVTPRKTEDRPVVFTNGSGLDDILLNTAELYLLFIIQELLDDVAEGVDVAVTTGGGLVSSDTFTTALAAVRSEIAESHASSISALDAAIAALQKQIDLVSTGGVDVGSLVYSEITQELASGGLIATKLDAVIGLLNTEVQNRISAISTESTARMSSDSSLAQQLSSIQSLVTDPDTGLAKANARITAEQDARITTDQAQADEIQTLTGAVGNALASIESEATSRANADTALAGRASTLEAVVNDPATGVAATNAKVESVVSTYATRSYAETLKSDALAAASSDATSKVSSEASARASADTALGTRIDNLQTSINTSDSQLSARIGSLELTSATKTEAEANKQEAITAAVYAAGLDATSKANAAQGAAITAAATDAKTKADTALADAKTYADTKVATVSAAVTAEQTARADADSALSSSINTVSSTVSGLSSTVSTQATAIANATGNINSMMAEYVLKLDANGVATGFKATAAGGGGQRRSDFAIFANKFTLVSNDGTTERIPFRVENGTTYADNLVINGRLRTGSIAPVATVINEENLGSSGPLSSSCSGATYNLISGPFTNNFWSMCTVWGWNTGSGYARDRFFRPDTTFLVSMDSWQDEIGDLGMGYRINGGAVNRIGPPIGTNHDNKEVIMTIPVTLTLSGTDYVEFGVIATGKNNQSRLVAVYWTNV